MITLTTILIIFALTIVVYFIFKLNMLAYKIISVVIIGLLIFSYISFTFSLKNTEADIKTVKGMTEATKLYFIWLGTMIEKTGKITGNSVDANNSIDIENNTINNTLEINNSINNTENNKSNI